MPTTKPEIHFVNFPFMFEPRKIVLILGNGFDLDLGLKTSYKDFWESKFCPKDYPAPLIKHLNSKWENNLDSVRWYDLENELLNYAKNGDKSDVVSEDERRYLLKNDNYRLFNIINYYGKDETYDSLFKKRIIVDVQKGYTKIPIVPHAEDFNLLVHDRDKKAFLLIKEGLRKYISSINCDENKCESFAKEVLSMLGQIQASGDFVKIYSFNYTQLPGGYQDIFKDDFHYVHGCCSEDKIIIGTRDDTTIDEKYDFMVKSFDPNYNPPILVSDLLEADEVVFFGHSIGENDRQYFKAFFKQQTDYSRPKRKTIVIITKNDNSEIQIKRALQQMTEGNLSTLYGLNTIRIIKVDNLTSDNSALLDIF